MSKKQKQIGEILVIGLLFIAILLSSVNVWGKIKNQEERNMIQNAKVVLYEGPKSLRDATEEDLEAVSEFSRDISLLHCTDTQITVNGQECFVYDTNVNHTRKWVEGYVPPIARTPIAYFDFEGTVEIQVKVPQERLETVKISPLSYNIEPKIDKENGTVIFRIDTPDTYTLTFMDSSSRAVHIFANPLETNIPDPENEDVIYIGPGEWNMESIALEDNQTLYLAGGAVVHSIVNGNYAKNITVCGRGIIDGSHLAGWQGVAAQIPLKFDHCANITLKDVIVLNPNAWACQAFASKDGIIDGLKIITPRPNGDGISLQSCENYQVSNCFVRTWDDSLVVKNYEGSSKGITFNKIQLWTDLAQSMEVGYETNKGNIPGVTMEDITFSNILVLNNFHKPIISIHNGDDAKVSNITFENIRIENARVGSGDGSEMPYLIDLNIDQSTNWSHTKERGTIENIRIENVEVIGGAFSPSRIHGFDETHKVSQVSFKNLIILGKKITTFEDGQFDIDPASTEQLTIQ